MLNLSHYVTTPFPNKLITTLFMKYTFVFRRTIYDIYDYDMTIRHISQLPVYIKVGFLI